MDAFTKKLKEYGLVARKDRTGHIDELKNFKSLATTYKNPIDRHYSFQSVFNRILLIQIDDPKRFKEMAGLHENQFSWPASFYETIHLRIDQDEGIVIQNGLMEYELTTKIYYFLLTEEAKDYFEKNKKVAMKFAFSGLPKEEFLKKALLEEMKFVRNEGRSLKNGREMGKELQTAFWEMCNEYNRVR